MAIIYCDVAATGANDGTSWTDAYDDIKTALDAMSTADELRIAKGHYIMSASKTFTIDDVVISGGWDGESSGSERDLDNNYTVLDGDGNSTIFTFRAEDCVVSDLQMVNANYLMYFNTYADGTVFNNILFAGSNGDYALYLYAGCDSVSFNNCVIQDGKQVYIRSHSSNSNIKFNDCYFVNNKETAERTIYVTKDDTEFNRCIFLNNINTEDSTASELIYNYRCKSFFYDCTFLYNDTTKGGGNVPLIRNYSSSGNVDHYSQFEGCYFYSNKTQPDGSYPDALFSNAFTTGTQGYIKVIDCKFQGNDVGYLYDALTTVSQLNAESHSSGNTVDTLPLHIYHEGTITSSPAITDYECIFTDSTADFTTNACGKFIYFEDREEAFYIYKSTTNTIYVKSKLSSTVVNGDSYVIIDGSFSAKPLLEPLPSYGTTETVDYLVEVQEKIDNTEQRMLLYDNPIRYMSLQYQFCSETEKNTLIEFLKENWGKRDEFTFYHPVTDEEYTVQLNTNNLNFSHYLNNFYRMPTITIKINDATTTIPVVTSFPNLFWNGYNEMVAILNSEKTFNNKNSSIKSIKVANRKVKIAFELNKNNMQQLLYFYMYCKAKFKSFTLYNQSDLKTYKARFDGKLQYTIESFERYKTSIDIVLLEEIT
jgi:hypothetical protein